MVLSLLGLCGTMTQSFSLDSATEVEDAVASEENCSGNIALGFRDGDDFGSGKAGLAEWLFKTLSDEAIAIVAVESNVIKIGSDKGIISKDKAAGVLVIVDFIPTKCGCATPVPYGESSVHCPGGDATKA